MQLSETDNDRTVDVRFGETVKVRLPENATTGYRWATDRYDRDIIDALGSEPRYPANAVGSGGEIGFAFKAKKAGSGDLVLKHWRRWEGDSSVTKRFHVRFKVQPWRTIRLRAGGACLLSHSL